MALTYKVRSVQSVVKNLSNKIYSSQKRAETNRRRKRQLVSCLSLTNGSRHLRSHPESSYMAPHSRAYQVLVIEKLSIL